MARSLVNGMRRGPLFALFATSAVLGGCGAQESSSHLRDDASDAAARDAAQIYVAIGATPNAVEPDAFRLVASGRDELAETGLRFCFGTPAECQEPNATVVAGVASVVNGRRVFTSAKYLRLLKDLVITVLAKTAANPTGPDVVQSLQIVAPTIAAGTTAAALPTPPTTAGTAPGAGGDACYKAPDAFTCDAEQEIARLTNEKRQSQGLAALAFDPKMGYVARLWSVEQARTGTISHDWFQTGAWGQHYEAEFHAPSPAFAENVAMNGGAATAADVAAQFVEQWWNSAGHRANMVGPYGTLGVGVSRGADGFYATQDFGDR